jgi:hypothetical protein
VSATINNVVAHFLDGRVLKGITRDFFPPHTAFHLFRGDSGVQVRCNQLKAVFFVRDLEGDANRVDLRGFIAGPAETKRGRKIAVRFADGELVCGYTHSFSPRRPMFFLFPADPGSNNERIFVNSAAASDVCDGAKAEELAQRVLDSRAA